jgi:hypothetical protein
MQIVKQRLAQIGTVLMMLLALVPLLPSFATEQAFTSTVEDSKVPSATKVLFIGNSITYVGELPEVFAALLRSENSQMPLKIAEVGGPSYKLDDHIRAQQAKQELQSQGPWDYVVIQEQSTLPCTNPDKCIASATALADAARAASAVPLFYEIWGSGIEQDYDAAHNGCKTIASAMNCDILPIATALKVAQRSLPGVQLFAEDKHHLAAAGQYLAACVVYAKVLRRSPEGLPSNLRAAGIELTPDVAGQLQNFAWHSLSAGDSEMTPVVARDQPKLPTQQAKAVESLIPSTPAAVSSVASEQSKLKYIQQPKAAQPLNSKIKISSIMGDTVMLDIEGTAVRLKVGEQYKSIKLTAIEGNSIRVLENGIEYSKRFF